MDKHKTAFISYRGADETELPFHLKNYLVNHKIDTFYDRDAIINHAPVISELREHVASRENFIILFSANSIRELIEYYREPYETDRIRYVYEELTEALKHNKNIIPVFFEKNLEKSCAETLSNELFVDCLGLEDGFHFVIHETNKSDSSLFAEILMELTDNIPSSRIDLSSLYWVGNRESDLPNLPQDIQFKGTISFFGETSTENRRFMCDRNSNLRVDHNDSADLDQDIFIAESIKQIISKDSSAKFMFYNQSTIHKLNLIELYGEEHFLCVNQLDILKALNNKRDFRNLIKDIVPLLPVIERNRLECDYDDLVDAYNNGEFEDCNNYPGGMMPIPRDDELQFIVQAPVSSGGAGTFVLNRNNADYLRSFLDRKAKYLVSVYHKNNIPVNTHVIIFQDRIIYAPGSVQIIKEVAEESKLLYKGADFIAFSKIEPDLQKQFMTYVKAVAEYLKDKGYRGVFGIDAIIHHSRVNILEVNGRFQASSELINRALLRRGYCSLQELNYAAFYGAPKSLKCALNPNFKVPFSNYSFCYEGNTEHYEWIYNQTKEYGRNTILQSDGFRPGVAMQYFPEAYLYRIAFNTNIVSVNEDGLLLIHENICGYEKKNIRKIKAGEKLAIKVALLMQGIRIENEVKQSLREATNNAVDLQFGYGENLMIINSPTNIKFVEYSPFSLVSSKKYPDKYSILYYQKLLIDNVGVFKADENQNKTLKDGKHKYSEVAYLSTDRLRIHLTNACVFKLKQSPITGKDMGCKFCNIPVERNICPITPKDIIEVVDTYVSDKREQEKEISNSVSLNHFLIGGQSSENCEEIIVKAAQALSKYMLPIYVMTLPLTDTTVKKLVKAGVLEFAYNIEIFNENCRKKYMPGKGSISLQDYLTALKNTRKILNTAPFPDELKAVRSLIIVGLEPYKDMIAGIRELIKNDIEPVLSIFRPLPGTPLENYNAPSFESVYNLFFTVSNMLFRESNSNESGCKILGPRCSCCQNNTLSLPWNIQAVEQGEYHWVIKERKRFFTEEP